MSLHTAVVYSGVTVEITGVNETLKQELLTAVSLSRQKDNEYLTPARIKSLYLRSDRELETALQANGYYHAVINTTLEENDENWTARYVIQPGDPVRIRDISLEITGEGKDDDTLSVAMTEFPLQSADRLVHGVYEAGKRRIRNIARERGYFDSGFTEHSITIHKLEYAADIELEFNSGPRYQFGDIIHADTVVSRQRLQGLFPFQTGDPYDANLLLSLGRDLRNSNYFSDVVVNPDMDNINERRVPVSIELIPKPKNSYRVGLGFGTDSGPRLSAAWEGNYVTYSGHRANADLSLSPTISSLSGAYLMPDFFRRGAEAGLLSSLSREDTDTSTSNIFKFGVRQLQTRWGWNEAISLSYQFEDFQVADTDSTSNLLVPGISYWKTVSDNPVYTGSGFRLGLDLRGSLEGAGSDISFLQTVIKGKYIRSIGQRGRLITRADFGATLVPDFVELPASIRFFAGGDNSIRGFDLQTLGPKNNDGQVIGGKFLTVGSVEYEHRIYEKWGAAVFTDFGNAFDDFSEKFVYSTGFGLRWLTPVGLIRVDLAFGVSEPGNPFRLHINVGPDL